MDNFFFSNEEFVTPNKRQFGNLKDSRVLLMQKVLQNLHGKKPFKMPSDSELLEIFMDTEFLKRSYKNYSSKTVDEIANIITNKGRYDQPLAQMLEKHFPETENMLDKFSAMAKKYSKSLIEPVTSAVTSAITEATGIGRVGGVGVAAAGNAFAKYITDYIERPDDMQPDIAEKIESVEDVIEEILNDYGFRYYNQDDINRLIKDIGPTLLYNLNDGMSMKEMTSKKSKMYKLVSDTYYNYIDSTQKKRKVENYIEEVLKSNYDEEEFDSEDIAKIYNYKKTYIESLLKDYIQNQEEPENLSELIRNPTNKMRVVNRVINDAFDVLVSKEDEEINEEEEEEEEIEENEEEVDEASIDRDRGLNPFSPSGAYIYDPLKGKGFYSHWTEMEKVRAAGIDLSDDANGNLLRPGSWPAIEGMRNYINDNAHIINDVAAEMAPYIAQAVGMAGAMGAVSTTGVVAPVLISAMAIDTLNKIFNKDQGVVRQYLDFSGYNYLGPGNNVKADLLEGKKPINALDKIAYKHDILYFSKDSETRQHADYGFVRDIDKLLKDPNIDPKMKMQAQIAKAAVMVQSNFARLPTHKRLSGDKLDDYNRLKAIASMTPDKKNTEQIIKMLPDDWDVEEQAVAKVREQAKQQLQNQPVGDEITQESLDTKYNNPLDFMEIKKFTKPTITLQPEFIQAGTNNFNVLESSFTIKNEQRLLNTMENKVISDDTSYTDNPLRQMNIDDVKRMLKNVDVNDSLDYEQDRYLTGLNLLGQPTNRETKNYRIPTVHEEGAKEDLENTHATGGWVNSVQDSDFDVRFRNGYNPFINLKQEPRQKYGLHNEDIMDTEMKISPLI